MHHARLFLAFAAAAALGAFIAACGTTVEKCSPASCAGCCDAMGACQAGGSNSSCGAQGNGCVSCQAGTNCEFGVCRTSSTNGGGGGATGGGGGGSTGGGGGSTTGGGGGTTGGGTGGGVTGGGTGGGVTGGGGGVTGGGTGGGGTGGGGAPMFDAGTVIRPDGGALNPPTIALTFMPNCGNVTSCPGNEVDAWAYSSGCIDDSAFSRVTSAAAGVGCTAAISNKSGSIAGSVVFDGTMVHRVVVGAVNFTLTAGGACASPQVCGFIPNALTSYGITGTCSLATDCVCALTFPIGQNGSQNYTYVAGALTVQRVAGGPETYQSCITGSSLQYRETTDGGIPGVFSLMK